MPSFFGRDEYHIQRPGGMGPRSRQGARDAELPDLRYVTLRIRSRGLYTEPGRSQHSAGLAERSNHRVPCLVDDLESRLAGLDLADSPLHTTSHARLARMNNRAPHRTASSQFPRHPDGYNIRAGPDNIFRGYGSGRYDSMEYGRRGYGSEEYDSEEHGRRRLGEYGGSAIRRECPDRPRHHYHHHESPRLNHGFRHRAYEEWDGVDERLSSTEYPPSGRRSRPDSPIRPYEVEEVE